MSIYKRKQLVTFIALSLLFTIVISAIFFNPRLDIFPLSRSFIEYSSICERDMLYIDSISGDLHYYCLNESNETGGILFHNQDLVKHVDLTKFQYIKAVISSDSCESVSVVLYFYLPGFSRHSERLTHRPYVKNFYLDGRDDSYVFHLDDFATPVQWFDYHSISEEDLPSTDWSKLTHLLILPLDTVVVEPVKIKISHLSFLSSASRSLIPGGIAGIILFLALSFYAYIKVRSRPIEIVEDTPPIVEGYTTDDRQRVVTFITENYGDPMMSLELVKKKTGLTNYHITEILKEECKMTYKQYLNYVRIGEAKRLLSQTDTPIGLIAEQVGYCYANSFARIFRQVEGITPNQYRKQSKNSN